MHAGCEWSSMVGRGKQKKKSDRTVRLSLEIVRILNLSHFARGTPSCGWHETAVMMNRKRRNYTKLIKGGLYAGSRQCTDGRPTTRVLPTPTKRPD